MEIVLGLLACAVTGLFVLQPFQQAPTGFILGLVLGPLGVAVAIVQRNNLRRDEQLAQHREIVYLLRRGTDDGARRQGSPE